MGEEASLRSIRDGRVAEIYFAVGALVRAGEVVATLDPAAQDQDLQVARDRVAVLTTEVESLVSRQRVAAAERRLVEAERLARATEGAQRRAVDTQSNVERRKDRAMRLEVELRRLSLTLASQEAEQAGRVVAAQRARRVAERSKRLAVDGIARAGRAGDLALEADELEASVVAFDVTIARTLELREHAARLLAEVEAATTDEEAMPLDPSKETTALERAAASSDEAALAVLSARLRVARAEIAAIESRAAEFEVRATLDGRLTALDVSPGSVVLAGDTLAVIQRPTAQQIELYVPAGQLHLSVSNEFSLARMTEPSVMGVGAVLRVSDSVERLPESLQLDPRRVAYGRCVHVGLPSEITFLTGERVLASSLVTVGVE